MPKKNPYDELHILFRLSQDHFWMYFEFHCSNKTHKEMMRRLQIVYASDERNSVNRAVRSQCRNCQSRRVATPHIRVLHIKRPPTTVEKFERPEYKYFQFRKKVDANIKGIIKSIPVTPLTLVGTLHSLCGVPTPPAPVFPALGDAVCRENIHEEESGAPHDPLEGWMLQRQKSYPFSQERRLLIPTSKPPVFQILNPQGEVACVFHVPPLLHLPPSPLMSLRQYLSDVTPHIQRCTPSFSPQLLAAPAYSDGKDAPTAHRRGVGVLIATRSEFTCFAVEPFHDRFRFVDDQSPIQIVSDDVVLPMGTHPDVRHKALSESLSRFAALVQNSSSFQSASSWWYRVDDDVAELLRTSFASPVVGSSCGQSRGAVDLEDPRWTMLPRSKLLKNVKWNVEPETMAAEMKYGLLEIMAGAHPLILQHFEKRVQPLQ